MTATEDEPLTVQTQASAERAVLVSLTIAGEADRDALEFNELVTSAGAQPIALLGGCRATAHPKYFVGTGKLEELRELLRDNAAELVIFNHDLSPGQESQLEAALECRVIDRTGLILDIFSQRAKTHEGKLQVELAQLQRIASRLVRGRTHLQRQRGGIGMRGPGETRLETDRRLVRTRIKMIERNLEKVRNQRDQGRRARRRAEIPTLSLVGYTNAGKSSLFNALTEADVFASNRLFATLDPTVRRISIGGVGPIVLADTVGFISDLPHQLIDAFRATLEETTNSVLLLHMVDASSPDRDSHLRQVEAVLAEIGADQLPVLRVFNKIDLLDNTAPRIDRDDLGKPLAVWLSASSGVGLGLLATALAELLDNDVVHASYRLNAGQGRLRSLLYQHRAVVSEQVDDAGGGIIEVRMANGDLQRLIKREGLALSDIRAIGAHHKNGDNEYESESATLP